MDAVMFGRLLGRCWLFLLFVCGILICDSQHSSAQILRRLRERALQSAAAATRPPMTPTRVAPPTQLPPTVNRTPQIQVQRTQPQRVQVPQAVPSPSRQLNSGFAPSAVRPSIVIEPQTGRQVSTTQRKLPLYRHLSTGRIYAVDPSTGSIVGDARAYQIYVDPQTGRPVALDKYVAARAPQAATSVSPTTPSTQQPTIITRPQNGVAAAPNVPAAQAFPSQGQAVPVNPQVAIANPSQLNPVSPNPVSPNPAASNPSVAGLRSTTPLAAPVSPTMSPIQPVQPVQTAPLQQPAVGSNDAFASSGKSILAVDEPVEVTKPTANIRPTLGLQVIESAEIAAVRVDDFKQHSLADEAGVRRGDQIVSLNGTSTPNIQTLATEISKLNAGDSVKLRVNRNNRLIDLTVPLVNHPSAASRVATAESKLRTPRVATVLPTPAPQPEIAEPIPAKVASTGPVANQAMTPDADSQPSGVLGLEVLDIAGSRGVEVAKIREGSPASTAGMKVGDRIVSIDGRLVKSGIGLAREVKMMNPDDPFAVQLVRDGKLIAMNMDLSAKKATSAASELAQGDAKSATQATPPQKSAGGFGSFLGGLIGGASGKPAEAKPSARAKPSAKDSAPLKAPSDKSVDDSVKLAAPNNAPSVAKGPKSGIAQAGFSQVDDLDFGDQEPVDRALFEELRPGSNTPAEVATPKPNKETSEVTNKDDKSGEDAATESVENLQAEIERLKAQLEKLKQKSKDDEA